MDTDKDKLNKAYSERNLLAIAFCKAAIMNGWNAGYHYDDNPEWDNKWRHVVMVDLPNGKQISWHMSPAEAGLAIALPKYNGKWDETFVSKESCWPSYI